MTKTQHTPGMMRFAIGMRKDRDKWAAEAHYLKAVNAQLLEALEAAQKALDSAEAVSATGTLGEDIDHWVLDPIPYASATSHIRAAIKATMEG